MEVDSFFQLVEGGVPYEVNCEGNIVEDVHIPLFPYVLQNEAREKLPGPNEDGILEWCPLTILKFENDVVNNCIKFPEGYSQPMPKV